MNLFDEQNRLSYSSIFNNINTLHEEVKKGNGPINKEESSGCDTCSEL